MQLNGVKYLMVFGIGVLMKNIFLVIVYLEVFHFSI
jgi:hypothetical protein